MRLGLVLDSTLDSNDGVQQYVKNLGRWMISKGHEVYFLVGESKRSSEFGDRVISLSRNITVKGNSNRVSFSLLPDLPKINKISKTLRLDLIHIQMPFSPFLGQILIGKFNVPTVGTFHIFPSNNLYRIGSKLLGALQKSSLNQIDRSIAISEAAANYAQNCFNINSELLPIMIDTDRFKSGRKLDKFNDGKFNILFMGRLVERKGIFYLLRALIMIKSLINHTDIRLIIAGDGPERSKIERFIHDNNLNNIVLEGHIDESDKPNYYHSADLCVFPSTHGESFGVVLIEAMAAGRAILAFNNEGYSSVLQKNLPETLVENRNIEELSSKIINLYKDHKLRGILGKKALEESKYYSLDEVSNQILSIYNELLDNRNVNQT